MFLVSGALSVGTIDEPRACSNLPGRADMASSLSCLDPVTTAADGVAIGGRFVDAIGAVAGALGKALTLDDWSWVGEADVFFGGGIVGLASF